MASGRNKIRQRGAWPVPGNRPRRVPVGLTDESTIGNRLESSVQDPTAGGKKSLFRGAPACRKRCATVMSGRLVLPARQPCNRQVSGGVRKENSGHPYREGEELGVQPV